MMPDAMTPQEPSPSSSTQDSAPKEATRGYTRPLTLCLLVVQLTVWLLAEPDAIDQLEHGFISPLSFLGAATSAILLGLGMVLLWTRRRIAIRVFVASSLIGLLASILWHPPFAITNVFIGAVAAATSSRVLKTTKPKS
jgi:hypothetical protein